MGWVLQPGAAVGVKQFVIGLGSFVPGLYRLLARGTGGSDSSRYCYAVWLRHLVTAHSHGLASAPPAAVAELGPGDSLGVGLAALICGSDRYVGLDAVQHASTPRNLSVFDELVDLFRRRSTVPTESEFQELEPPLATAEFPAHVLTDEHLRAALAPARLATLRRELATLRPGRTQGPHIRYVAPWHDLSLLPAASVDMVLSQAVLEHVGDPALVHRAARHWLRPGGFVSHQIDFRSHGLAAAWNGHWAYGDLEWRLILGRRPYLLNREPHSAHGRLLREAGFDIVCDLAKRGGPGLGRSRLAPRFRDLSDDDLTTASAFIQARRAP